MADRSDIVTLARQRWSQAEDADEPQRARERLMLQAYAGDQWPADIKAARMGQQILNGAPAVPARPTLVINKFREPVRQVLNQERASDIGISLVPADDFGDLGVTPDDTEITLREGLIRRIQRESIAADARTWAFARAVQAGRGYYMVMTRYLPGKTWDQEVYLHRIYNQAGVMLDPSHTMPDGSDCEWEFVGTDLSWERYQAEFGRLGNGKKNPVCGASDQEWRGLGDEAPGWFTTNDSVDGKRRNVRVVDYWYKSYTTKTLALMPDGSTVWADELPEGVEPEDTRPVSTPTITWCKLDGCQVLEETTWPGTLMPIVKVVGEEMQPYDGDRRVQGLVEPAMDAQLGFNYMVSKQVEQIGLTPIPPLMVDPVAISGYEAMYNASATRALPYLPTRTYDDQGRQLTPPHRPNVDPNILAISQSIQMFDMAIKSTTAVPDSTLGNVDPTLKSGKAIAEVVANAQMSTSNFLDNLVRSMRYEGQIINDLLYPIYGVRPGRLMRVLNGEGEPEQLRLVGQEGQPQVMGAQQPDKVYKLTKDAHFNVIIKVTKSFDSRRTQEATIISELLSANPVLMTWFGDLFFKNQDGPGHQQMADRAKVMLDPKILQLLAAKEQGGAEVPPEVQAELAALREQLQAAEGAMQELAQEREGKVLEHQSQLEIEQLKAQAFEAASGEMAHERVMEQASAQEPTE